MSIAADGDVVQSQEPNPSLTAPDSLWSREEPAGLELKPDVLVVGGGAGGLNAAIAAATAGAEVLVLDERKVTGGQYFKQPMEREVLLDTQQRRGAELLEEARRSGVQLRSGVELWGAFAGPTLFAVDDGGQTLILKPRQLIVASGAYERPRMVPGWTLPGVMTTGAAQTLWRSYRRLPGRRVAICGSGPLNQQVALELARGSAEVCLVAESAPDPLMRPLAAMQLLLAGPGLVRDGLATRMALRSRGVSLRYATELVAVENLEGGKLLAKFRRGQSVEDVELDALCMNDGFEPQNEILRLLGAAMAYDRAFGHLRCERDDDLKTTVENVYAVGDCCGLGGAPAAAAEGVIAGTAAARACGFASAQDLASTHRTLDRARRFQKYLWALHDPKPQAVEDISDDTIICRCEELSAGELRQAVDDEAGDVGSVKRATRVGMGCCQGRYCGPVAARLSAESKAQAVGEEAFFAPRVPVKPVSVGALLAAQDAMNARESSVDDA